MWLSAAPWRWAPSSGSQGSSSVLINFDGTLNGNLLIDSSGTFSSIGSGARGIQLLGGIPWLRQRRGGGGGAFLREGQFGEHHLGRLLRQHRQHPGGGCPVRQSQDHQSGKRLGAGHRRQHRWRRRQCGSGHRQRHHRGRHDRRQRHHRRPHLPDRPVPVGLYRHHHPARSRHHRSGAVDHGLGRSGLFRHQPQAPITATPIRRPGECIGGFDHRLRRHHQLYLPQLARPAVAAPRCESNGAGGGPAQYRHDCRAVPPPSRPPTVPAARVSAVALAIGAYATVPRIDVAGEFTNATRPRRAPSAPRSRAKARAAPRRS